MATIIERNGKYLARVRKDGFKPVAKTFSRKADAKAWGARVEADMESGRWVEKTDKVPTLSEAVTEYRQHVADKLKGAEFYAFTFDQVTKEPFASKTLDSVSAADLAGWRDRMTARGLAAGTVVRRLGLMSGLFTWCLQERGWISVNPLKAVRKPRVSDARDRVLSDDERAALLAAAGASRADWLPDVLVVLLQSAMRRGELWGLTVADVDFSAAVALLDDTKNGSSRQVPLCGEAVAALRRLADRATAAAAIDRAAGLPAPAKGAERLVPVGDPPAISLAFRRVVARAQRQHVKDCQAAGVEPVSGFLAGVRLHDLRHTSVTSWAATGALSVHELQAISGHKTAAMLSRYVNLPVSALAAKLARLNTAKEQA